MNKFEKFATALNKRLTTMSKGELYVAGDSLDKDSIWLTYLESFPAGTNPMFRERTEHDCSTCRQFIKGFGNVVEIVDNKVQSLWLVADRLYDTPYAGVAVAMNQFVMDLTLSGVFRSSEHQYGAEKTHSLTDGKAETWHHFHGKVDRKHFSQQVGTDRGNFDAAVQVLGRGLDELLPGAVETVVDLIDNGSLYRGEEHLSALTAFRSIQNQYRQLPEGDRRAFVFANANSQAARFRNTVIGTLVTDLSSGVDLEQAVRSFESKVAPTNYKRPKALITPAMVSSAMKTINDLGIEDSLKRRFARLSDISVNNVLWVDNDTQKDMKDGIEGLLMAAATTSSSALSKNAKPESMSISQFMKDVLPSCNSIELLVKNAHEGNFVSLTTGTDPDAPPILKWDNSFAWSYGGNVTDSIKEKVKRAGGNVTGKLRFSLSWFNYDDLDIHLYEPDGNHVWYGSKQGKLDVDMNAGGRSSREPVENITYGKGKFIMDGAYRIVVNQYSRREAIDVGFVVETESDGRVEQYHYDKLVQGNVEVGVATVKNAAIVGFKPGPGIQGGSTSKEIWGIKTEDFVPVRTVMYSPNYWDDQQIGNRHWFFMLRGCLNDAPARGLYNEFLSSRLDAHRKVFEVLGSKMMAEPTSDQLSGLGFSSTQKAQIVARVNTGSRTRLLEIQF